MQTLVLVVSRFQVSVVNRQYEKSRWSLVAAAVLLITACKWPAASEPTATMPA